MAPRVLVFGAGTIGTVYLYFLQQAGASITAVCRSNYEAVTRDGFTLNSELLGQNLKIKPHVVRTVEEAKGAFDFVLVTTKAFPGSTPPQASLIAPAVGPQTTIALLQNGIDFEEEYRSAFPSNPILSCVVYIPATPISAGVVWHGNLEFIELGAYPSSASRGPADALADLLRTGGSNANVFDDVQARRWSKLLINTAWNPICALTRATDVAFLNSSPVAGDFVYAVMLETVAVAQALGYEEITEASAKMQLDRSKGYSGAGFQPSMLSDVLSGSRLEVEVILGNVVKIGKEKGVSVVRLEALYALTKAYDVGAQQRQDVVGEK